MTIPVKMDDLQIWPRLGTLLFALFLQMTNGAVFNNNFHVLNGEGFLVKPISPTNYPLDTTSVESEQFYIYNQNTATKVSTSVGSLDTSQNVTYNLNDYSNADPLSTKVVNLDQGANISAHLIQKTVTNTKPNLKVLIHSDRTLDKPRCVRVFAKRRETETVSNYCILSNDNHDSEDNSIVCLADVALPYEWWSSRDIDVFYDVQDVEVCTIVSNTINPSNSLPNDVFYVGEVLLMFDDRHGAREISEDKNIVLSLPDKAQEPGTQFTVTVKLHSGSPLQMFVVRVESGDGLLLRSVTSADSERWDVKFRRVGSSDSVAEINAVTRNGYHTSPKAQEVIQCHFEVQKSTIKLESTIIWRIGYQDKSTQASALPDEAQFHEQTISTSIPIAKSDQVTHLVAVMKTHELVSLRRFTNTVSTIPVWLYSVDKSDNISPAHSSSQCYSLRPTILEVSKLCDMIYLSGEGSDPGIVDIMFEYASIRHSVDVRIWYPDVKMFIKLSDERLSEIKSWKVRSETNDARAESTECTDLQYQTSDVQVYTKFYTVHQRRDVYMRGGKVEVFADITGYVRHLVQTSDRDVVRYEGSLLRGISPGKATVKVVTTEGIQLAATDIKVTASKTSVDMISGNFVSDVNMAVSKSHQPGLLTASYTYDRRLSDKLPEGVLELWVHFKDLQVVPLASFDRNNYRIEIENETPTILILPSDNYQNRYIPVRAVGSGRGVLKITLYMDELCQKKASRYLSIGYVYVESDVTKLAGQFVNDAAYRSEGNSHLFNLWGKKDKSRQSVTKNFGRVEKTKPGINKPQQIKVETINDDSNGGGGLTPLETGMFVLMGVLGVVASVFVTNCLVYMARQNKRENESMASSVGSEKVDSGWVWLNKSTLEENAVSTEPEQFLSERDFQKRCSRSDSLQSTRSKRSSGTYKGSECSVRITVNPRHILNLPELSDSEEDELYSSSASRNQPIIGLVEPELSDLGEDFSLHSVSSTRSRRRQSSEVECDPECHQSFIIHSDEEEGSFMDEMNDNDEVDLDTSTGNLTQEQFDNLRESVA